MPRLTDKNTLTTVASDDLLHVVDVDDTTGSTAGTSKKATVDNVVGDALGATIDSNKNIIFDGSIVSEKVGLFTYVSTPTAVTVTTAGTYYSYSANFVREILENISISGEDVQYDGAVTQHFKVDWYITCSGDSNGITVGVGVRKNGTPSTISVMSAFMKTAGEVYAISGTYVTELATGQSVGAILTADGDGDIVTVHNGTFTITEFFD